MPVDVSLVAIPDALVSTLSGIWDVLNSFALVNRARAGVPPEPFRVEIVAPTRARVGTASRLSIQATRAIGEVDRTDVVIVPSLLADGVEWRPGRYPDVVRWLSEMYAGGAALCSTCTGVLLLAETGLLDGKEATIHWTFAPTFRRNYPAVRLNVERALVVTGDRGRLIMSGASTSWHDLVLYLIGRHVGAAAAREVARFFALQWHADGLASFVLFDPPTDHGDAVVRHAQDWVDSHFAAAHPVEGMVRRSGVPERSFKRRFTRATGHAPIAYVQHLRVQDAKRRLERTDAPVDEIGWRVGYEDPAFFRRLFKRVTGVPPAAYRRRFRVPGAGG